MNKGNSVLRENEKGYFAIVGHAKNGEGIVDCKNEEVGASQLSD